MNISDIQKYRGQDLSHRYSLTDEEYKFLEEHFEKLELLWKYKRALEEADEEKEEKFKYINICFELRKAFEDAKKERDCRVAECQKKIEELKVENAEFHCEMQAMKVFPDEIPEEPIKAAEMLITAKGECDPLHIRNDVFKDTYRIFDVSELRQIAEHLLVYCNSQKENVNEQ